VAVLCLLVSSLSSRAGTFTDPSRGFAFDWPETWSFRPFPSIPGGAFAPARYAADPNRFGSETIFVNVDEDYENSPSAEAFLERYAFASCAADGCNSSQYCREGSVRVEPFVATREKGFLVRRTVVNESFQEEDDEEQSSGAQQTSVPPKSPALTVEEREDRFIAFPLAVAPRGERVFVVFSADTTSAMPEMEAIARTFRRLSPSSP